MTNLRRGRRRNGLASFVGLFALGGFLCAGASARGAAGAAPPAAAAVDSITSAPLADVPLADSLAVETRLAAARGRWFLVNIWATWCRPCVQETPELVSLARALPAERFAALGLSTDLMIASEAAARQKVAEYRHTFGVPYPLVLFSGSNDALADRFRLGGAIPVTLLYDPDGVEAGRWERRLTKADLARIRALVAGQSGGG